ncbi:MAG: hypothetical protein ACRCSP_08890 [Rhodoglobus sp.]
MSVSVAHYGSQLPAQAQHQRHIEIVTTREQRKTRPKVAYAVVAIMSLSLIFAAQLLLSVVVSDGAFQIDKLQQQRKELLRTQDALNEKVNLLSSTQNLATQAAHLGMVPNSTPLTMNIETGAVYASPGTADPSGCGGKCNLITNSLLTGMPLISTTVAVGATNTVPSREPQAEVMNTPATPEPLPAPVTQ